MRTTSAKALVTGWRCPTTTSGREQGDGGEAVEDGNFEAAHRIPFTTRAAVSMTFTVTTGSSTFQPKDMSWS